MFDFFPVPPPVSWPSLDSKNNHEGKMFFLIEQNKDLINAIDKMDKASDGGVRRAPKANKHAHAPCNNRREAVKSEANQRREAEV